MSIGPVTSRIRAGVAILAGIVILGLLIYGYVVTAQRDTARARVVAEQKAHQATVANYRAARAEAARRDAENRARVEAEQRAASERIAHDYESRIAAVREQYDRILRERARAGSGGARPAPVPAPGVPSPRIDGPPTEDGFSLPDRLIATEQALQLEALQQYVRDVIAIINNQPAN